MRKVELAEVQRLEADARRKTQEKERRVEQEKDRAAARKTLEVKIAAQSFAHQYLGTIHNSVFDLLHEQGFFYDPLRKEIEDIAMTDLLSILKNKSDYYESAQLIIDELIVAAKIKAKCYEGKALILRREAAELHVIEIARAAQLKANADMIAAQTKAAEEDEEDREGEDSFV